MKKNKYEIDMCNGTIMDKLISFSLPLMVSGILQLMFNAVDIIVVGRFSGSQALAAVGSTTALINVFINLFMGISLGANVLAARYYAAGRDREMSETVHTSIMLALISGVVMAFVGVFFASRRVFRVPSSTSRTCCCSHPSIPSVRLQWQATRRPTMCWDFYTPQSTPSPRRA